MTPVYSLFSANRPDRFIDLANQRFGRLLPVAPVAKVGTRGRPLWLCLCDCGKPCIVTPASLRNGRTTSCGCFGIEQRTLANRKHGHSSHGKPSGAYQSWYSMKQRCDNPKTPGFERWGGRGITYAAKWAEFASFLADMGDRPDGSQLDRINNDGNYEKSNCRWATPKENCNNTSRSRRHKFDGRMLTVGEIANERGLRVCTVQGRLWHGWPIDRLGDPLKHPARNPHHSTAKEVR